MNVHNTQKKGSINNSQTIHCEHMIAINVGTLIVNASSEATTVEDIKQSITDAIQPWQFVLCKENEKIESPQKAQNTYQLQLCPNESVSWELKGSCASFGELPPSFDVKSGIEEVWLLDANVIIGSDDVMAMTQANPRVALATTTTAAGEVKGGGLPNDLPILPVPDVLRERLQLLFYDFYVTCLEGEPTKRSGELYPVWKAFRCLPRYRNEFNDFAILIESNVLAFLWKRANPKRRMKFKLVSCNQDMWIRMQTTKKESVSKILLSLGIRKSVTVVRPSYPKKWKEAPSPGSSPLPKRRTNVQLAGEAAERGEDCSYQQAIGMGERPLLGVEEVLQGIMPRDADPSLIELLPRLTNILAAFKAGDAELARTWLGVTADQQAKDQNLHPPPPPSLSGPTLSPPLVKRLGEAEAQALAEAIAWQHTPAPLPVSEAPPALQGRKGHAEEQEKEKEKEQKEKGKEKEKENEKGKEKEKEGEAEAPKIILRSYQRICEMQGRSPGPSPQAQGAPTLSSLHSFQQRQQQQPQQHHPPHGHPNRQGSLHTPTNNTNSSPPHQDGGARSPISYYQSDRPYQGPGQGNRQGYQTNWRGGSRSGRRYK